MNNATIPKSPRLAYIGNAIKTILIALGLSIVVYIFLSICNWAINPVDWNGLSRFIAAIAVLSISISFYDDLKSNKRKYKHWKEQQDRFDESKLFDNNGSIQI